MTGETRGDNEVITIKLHEIDQNIDSIWPVVTIYERNKHFNDVKGAYCRIIDNDTN